MPRRDEIVHTPETYMELFPVRAKRNGKVPIGFKVDPENDKFIVSIPREIVALQHLYRMSKNRNYSLRELSEWFKSACGRELSWSIIARMRNGEFYPLALKMNDINRKTTIRDENGRIKEMYNDADIPETEAE